MLSRYEVQGLEMEKGGDRKDWGEISFRVELQLWVIPWILESLYASSGMIANGSVLIECTRIGKVWLGGVISLELGLGLFSKDWGHFESILDEIKSVTLPLTVGHTLSLKQDCGISWWSGYSNCCNAQATGRWLGESFHIRCLVCKEWLFNMYLVLDVEMLSIMPFPHETLAVRPIVWRCISIVRLIVT